MQLISQSLGVKKMQLAIMERPMASGEKNTIEQALGLVDREYTSSNREVFKVDGTHSFGELIAFTSTEIDQLTSLRDHIVRYVSQRSVPRPLCLAVFGPPGSGKSFAVKQIKAEVEHQISDKHVKLPLTIVNLTQVSHSNDLGRILARIAGEQEESTVPIVFFDEFDARREGAAYGWLGWFLAPMHDGEFMHEGALIRLRRAVYVFAGGTAESMDEFSDQLSVPAFRSAKGPDFISRLRAFLDVQGPNSEPRPLRRASILRNELQNQAVRNGSGSFRPDRGLLRSLLLVGRYRHGARSIGAIVELSDLSIDKQQFTWDELPEDHLLGLHVDRGPLDSRLIGGSIALSALTPSNQQESRGLDGCWLQIAAALWRQGATLAFAGNWPGGQGGDLMQILIDSLRDLPVDPSRTKDRRENPAPWLDSFPRETPGGSAPVDIDAVMSPQDRRRHGLRVVTAQYLTPTERKTTNEWQAKVIERFRRRLAVTEDSIARFAIGGATKIHNDARIPGVAEEVMLTLANGHPVYIAGGFGGAASDVGFLLGLAQPRTGGIPDSLTALLDKDDELLGPIADKLKPPPWHSLPVTVREVVSFIRQHAFGGSQWPDNGLTAPENRELFQSSDANVVQQLVLKGLRRRFDSA